MREKIKNKKIGLHSSIPINRALYITYRAVLSQKKKQNFCQIRGITRCVMVKHHWDTQKISTSNYFLGRLR